MTTPPGDSLCGPWVSVGGAWVLSGSARCRGGILLDLDREWAEVPGRTDTAGAVGGGLAMRPRLVSVAARIHILASSRNGHTGGAGNRYFDPGSNPVGEEPEARHMEKPEVEDRREEDGGEEGEVAREEEGEEEGEKYVCA